MSGPQDGDKDGVDPFAGLAEGYDGDDELMLEALGIKPAPLASPKPVTPAPASPVTPAPASPGAPAGAMPPEVLQAILAAIPDAVRSAISEGDAVQPPSPMNAAPHSAPRAADERQLEGEAFEHEAKEPAPVQADPTPEFELAPELAAFMDEEPAETTQPAEEEVGVDLTPESPPENPDPTLDESGKLKGLLGRIRGKPAAEIARGSTGPGRPTPQGASAGSTPLGAGAAKQISNLKLQLETAKSEVDKARKKLAQLQAETVTFRKRLGEQVKEGNLRGREDVFKAVITVFDSIASALASSKESRDFDNLYDGVEMIERQLHQALKPLGLTGVDATGEKFDPAQHEAMRMMSTGKEAPGTVVEQIRKGFRAGDKLIRPALVIVEAQQGSGPPTE